MATVLIGCKLPNGLQIRLVNPDNPSDVQTVLLNGQNQNSIGKNFYVPPVPYGETQVDSEFWQAWKKQNAGLAMVRNGLVFEAPVNKPSELAAKAKDAGKSGLEPMQPADMKKIGVEEAK